MRIAPPEVLDARLAALKARLQQHDLDALVVVSLPNIAYLTGFFASAGLLVAMPDELILLADSRYGESLAARAQECPFVQPRELSPGESYDAALVEALEPLRGNRVGFEAAHLTVRRHLYLTRSLASRGWSDPLVDTDGLVEELRAIKDPWELSRIRDGAVRLSEVANCILSNGLAGRTEAEIAAEVDAELRRAGFERPAFDTIVASGPNSARPHARPGPRRIEDGDLVVLDCGGVLDGYCTDLSRTVVVGRGGARERRLIEQVTEAQAAAFAAVKPGAAPEDVDAAAREVLAGHGLADAFLHGTGHGIGLEVHELPRVTRKRAGYRSPPLAAGMVLTLEPGAYISGWGGARIEDDVLVTESGAERLTT